MPKELSDQEQRFVELYLVDLKPYEAAKGAGYAESTSKTKSFSWVSNSKCPPNKRHVFDAIQKAKVKRADETGYDAKWVLQRLGLLAEFNINKFKRLNDDGMPYYDFSEATDDDWYCITEMTIDHITKGQGDDQYSVERVKIKGESKLKALELMGRHVDVQAFKDSLEVEVTDKKDIIAKARERALNANK